MALFEQSVPMRQSTEADISDEPLPQTTMEMVIRQLRSMIMSGSIKPSERVREADIAQRLEVSRTPVRHALGILEREGLLTYTPNRGFAVRPFDIGDFEQAYAVRAELEAMAARVAAERGLDSRTYAQMQACIDAVSQMTADHGELKEELKQQWRQQNARFHDLLHRAVGNRYLIEALALVQRIPLVHHALALYYSRESVMTYNNQHQEILKAIGMRQGTRAAHLMWEHVTAGQEVITSRLNGESVSGKNTPRIVRNLT